MYFCIIIGYHRAAANIGMLAIYHKNYVLVGVSVHFYFFIQKNKRINTGPLQAKYLFQYMLRPVSTITYTCQNRVKAIDYRLLYGARCNLKFATCTNLEFTP